MHRIHRLALTLLALLPITAAAQNRYIDIEADASKMVNDGAGILTGGVTYTLAVKHDVGEYVFYPTITNKNPLPNHSSDFRFYMSAHPGTTTPGEKMLINVVKYTDSYAPAWNQTKTIGFEVRLGDDYKLQSKRMQLSEWWQGSPYGAIAEMFIIPGTTRWAIGIENTDHNTQRGSPAQEIVIQGNELKRNQWYKFEIAVKPNYAANGSVQAWQDDRLVGDSHDYAVGYDPSRVVGTGGGGLPLKGFDVEVGEYRPANTANAEIFFDSIRWGDRYEDIK